MRILSLDYGSRTIGVAMSDPTGLLAQPFRTIWRKKESMIRKSLKEIEDIVKEYNVEKIIMGLPLNMDGSEGDRVLKTRDFAEKLSNRVEIPIEFLDERLTTVEAGEILSENGMRKENHKTVIDQVAACIILQTYLDDSKNNF